MLIMKGKYNIAKIMTDVIDETTKEQIQSFLNHPAFADGNIVIQADTHAGKGAVIGFTWEGYKYIIPNLVGVDCGCGILSVNFGQIELDCKTFDEFIKQNIPYGMNVNKEIPKIYEYWHKNKIEKVCHSIDLKDTDRVGRAMGSLGGGNHFIEAGRDENNNLWITIHSGSRNFGLQVATYHQKKAYSILQKYLVPDINKDLAYLPIESKEAVDYINDLKIAQDYAKDNRNVMINRIIRFISTPPIDIVFSVHNYIGDDNIIRKGAISAEEGERVIIPFNMRDGLIIGVGKGNKAYNYSAPHGAGRILSRTQAKKDLNADEFKKQMEGIYTSTANKDTLDEAPGAYKDKQIILDSLKDTVEITHFVKPIYNFKAAE